MGPDGPARRCHSAGPLGAGRRRHWAHSPQPSAVPRWQGARSPPAPAAVVAAGPEQPRRVAALSWATWPRRQPQALTARAKPVNATIPRLLLFGNFVACGSSLPTTERLIIRYGLCMDKDMNFADTPGMRLILCAACIREITVIEEFCCEVGVKLLPCSL